MDFPKKWVGLPYLACCMLAGLAAGGMAGCDAVTPIYTASTGGQFGADISPRNTWVVRGDLAGPAAAADGDLTTAARSDYNYAGAELTIDLKKLCLFQTIIIEHGRPRDGQCRSVGVATSVDGKVFIDRYVAPGTRRVTIISLPAPTLARYVRIKALRPGRGPWFIAEIYLQ